MKNFENIKVTPALRRCFEKSNMITDAFDDDYVRSAYVMLAIMSEPSSLVSKGLAERGIIPNPAYIVDCLINDKESFEMVFGKKAAEKCFNKTKEEPNNDVVNNIEIEIENVGTFEKENENIYDEEKLKNVVAQAISDILMPEMELDIKLEVVYSDKLQAICEDAATRCLLGKQDYLDIDNLTYSILKNENSSGYKVLKTILDIVNDDGLFKMEPNDIIEFILQNGNIHIISDDEKNTVIIPKNLESCCTILNDKFKQGVKSDILGRDEELFKLWNIFSKRTKRNAILLGEAGVGKTAIVEALVQEIVNGTCPEEFRNYTVLELDVGATVAGTKYRGELEEKLAKLKKFLENTPNIILFVDEIHQLIGMGSSEDSGFDMSGALKPILARGDVVFVGATTVEEYKKYIEKEQAFKRRFEPIIVKEPKHNEVAEMIKAKVESLSSYHKVTLEEGLLDYIIVCASAFNLTGTNPDKSIDLCDRSMAIAKMRNSKIVQKKDVDRVYSKNYERLKNMPEEIKKNTVYHEASHYVMSRVTSLKKVQNVIAVSIVPGDDFLGAYIYDELDDAVQATYEYYMDKIKCLVAGRVGQMLFCNSFKDAGASSDIEKATLIAQCMITEYALVGTEINNTCLKVNKDYIDEKMKAKIQEKCKEIIEKATKSTEEILSSNKVFFKVERVANLLLEKKIATAKELEEAFSKE